MTIDGGGSAAASSHAAADAAAAQLHNKLLQWESLTMMEPIACPVCARGKLLPLLMTNATNWVCSQPECGYVIHQHGSDNTKIWKGQAHKPTSTHPSDGWLETP